MIDFVRSRRENMRWNLINTLYKARPYAAPEKLLFDVIQNLFPDVTPLEIRQELTFLADGDLIDVRKEANGHWFADLSCHGVNLAEYAVDCPPGIARPLKVWGDE